MNLPLSYCSYRRRASSALIIVLACLVFISVLIVAFFASVTTERQSAQFYANSSSVKLLSDSTLSIVMGQIVNATRGVDSSANTLSWASQPGMIRNYNTQGTAAGYYKLYSWTNMVGTGAFSPIVTAEQVPATWATQKALYTDLNDPIIIGSGSSAVTNWPIVDPSATNSVVGFSITGAPVSATDAAPMPVQWLYVLEKGQVIGPDSGGDGTTATFLQSPIKPNATNQIVGRVAFWTDDDTSKININTAAGDVWVNTSGASSGPAPLSPGNPGSFWDTPRIYGPDTNLATYQPANGEYQRYPGHPATVYLSSVFTNLTTPSQIYTLTGSTTGITPRVGYGGSKSGTAYPPSSMLTAGQVASSRLYASVDELASSTNMSSGSRTINSPLTKASVEQAKFFLTAASRAPEVNLYNQPRVTVWPVSSTGTTSLTGTYVTNYDLLMAYCGTLNGKLYYFQRGPSYAGTGSGANATGAYSPTADLPTSASPSASATDLTRNRQLISYLRSLTALPVPGFSTGTTQTFVSKYPKDRDQILTEIFDYIRSLNTQDINVTRPYTPSANTTPAQGQIFPITDTTHDDSNTTPLRGFGRFPIITEASVMFVGIGQTSTSGSFTSMSPTTSGTISPGKTRVQAAILLKFFDPNQGYAPFTPNFRIKVIGLNNMSCNGTSMGFPSTATIDLNIGTYTQVPNMSRGTGGEVGIQPCVWATGYTSNLVSPGTFDTASGTLTALSTFSFGDTPFTVNITDTLGTVLQTYTLDFPAGTFPVPGLAPRVVDNTSTALPPTYYAADFRNLGLVTTVPTGTIFAPTGLGSTTTSSGSLVTNGTVTTSAITITGSIVGRFNNYVYGRSNMCQTFICGTDVVRSIALTTDPRLISTLSTVPLVYPSGSANAGSNIYAKVTGYDTPTVLQAHGITDFNNGSHRGFVGYVTFGKLSLTSTYSFSEVGNEPDFTYLSISGTTNTLYPLSALTPSPWGSGIQPQAGTTLHLNNSVKATGIPAAVNIGGANIFSLVGGYAVATLGVFLPPGSTTIPGDWDNGNGNDKDGAYVNKADEGAIPYYNGGIQVPYFGAGYNTSITGTITIAAGANFSPNRQMPSAGMFGSLSTGVFSNTPWQTLLFRPSPDGSTLTHIGAKSPQDHLIMDLFNMPIVEPYAISDPFSSAGKINMNYQIVPFTYITRSTAIQAAMRSEQILAIPASAGTNYKSSTALNYRYFLDLAQTLTGFTNMFTYGSTDGGSGAPDIFRSATQICNIWLVPSGKSLTYAGMKAFWLDTSSTGGTGGFLTGDNARERPYANLYQKLTTKSNTFTVHMRVQTLKMLKATDTTYASWVEGSEAVTGEYRGSSTIERYLDTTDTRIPDYATLSQPLTAGQAIDNFYKFRVIETKQFTP